MFLRLMKSAIVIAVVLLLSSYSDPSHAQQEMDMTTDENDESANALISSAMDAYSNLEMQKAKALLDQALEMADTIGVQTLAKIHVSMGVVWIGGFSDNVNGQGSFTTALCLDAETKVDPLFSTPDIEMVFASAKSNATPEACQERGLGQVEVAPEPTITPCGSHVPLVEQKRNYELPIYMQAPHQMREQLHKVVLFYAFDVETEFREMEMDPHGAGYAKVLSCEQGGILEASPEQVTYYIEGRDINGNPICGHGDAGAPLEVLMTDEVAPLPPVAGLKTIECVKCEDWDEECRKRKTGYAAGDPCTMDSDCAAGLVCSDGKFICVDEAQEQMKEEDDDSGVIGPKWFYAQFGIGTGVGYVSKNVKLVMGKYNEKPGDNELPYDFDPRSQYNENWNEEYAGTPFAITENLGAIVISKQKVPGFAWSGIPVRLALGFNINPKLSLEVSGRVDVFIVEVVEPVSCADNAKNEDVGEIDAYSAGACNLDIWDDVPEEHQDGVAEHAIARKAVSGENGEIFWDDLLKTRFQLAWLVNARLRYKAYVSGGSNINVFGGLGYGHIQYRIPSETGNKHYYPMPGMVNIEVGLGYAYWFSKHVGITLDIPIDFVVGDGFAVNFDFNLGVGVGF